jgi:hypothetical protein
MNKMKAVDADFKRGYRPFGVGPVPYSLRKLNHNKNMC